MEANKHAILKDCPHCGKKENIKMESADGDLTYYVFCEKCSLDERGSQMAAGEAWNTRAGEDAMQAEIVRLKAENERLLAVIESKEAIQDCDAYNARWDRD